MKISSSYIAEYLAAMKDAGIISNEQAESFWIDAQTSPNTDELNKRFHEMRGQYVKRNGITLSLLVSAAIAVADRLSIDPVFAKYEGKAAIKQLTKKIDDIGKNVYKKINLSEMDKDYVSISCIFDECSIALNRLSLPEMLFIFSIINETARNGVPNIFMEPDALADDELVSRMKALCDTLLGATEYLNNLSQLEQAAETEDEARAYAKAAKLFEKSILQKK